MRTWLDGAFGMAIALRKVTVIPSDAEGFAGREENGI
jgi:hypothetical protein